MKKLSLFGVAVCLFLSVLAVGCGIPQEQYDSIVAQLNSVQQELQAVQSELESTKSNLNYTDAELQLLKAKLDMAELGLSSTTEKLNTIETELNSTKAILEIKKTELTSAENALGVTEDALAETQAELSDLQISYEGLMTGQGYTIKDPTYREMTRFLQIDETSSNEYIKDEYDCEYFAADVCSNAEEAGIRCALVLLQHPDGISHAIVAFNTIDKGMIYVEPQTDDLAEVEVGKPYYECVIPKPGYFYPQPEYDDTITDIIIVW